MKCSYCGKLAEWVENKEVYGRNYGTSYMIWFCKECDAYVGCHKNTKNPLGTMANKELRELRKKAKNKFITEKMGGDWKNKKLKAHAYVWLKTVMNKEFHFGGSTKQECEFIFKLLTSHRPNEDAHGVGKEKR